MSAARSFATEHFRNRELSLLAFNRRVLAQAADDRDRERPLHLVAGAQAQRHRCDDRCGDRGEDGEHLIFFTRNHTPLTTNNVRRRLRTILEGAGISGVTPHSFRRTVATVLDRASGAELAAEMLGHTSSKITKEHYIQPDEAVNPVTAEILESLAPRTGKRAVG